jgi:hypothetical protein
MAPAARLVEAQLAPVALHCTGQLNAAYINYHSEL